MKRWLLFGVIVGLFLGLSWGVNAGAVSGAGQWRSAFPDAVSGTSGATEVKNPGVESRLPEPSQKTLLGRWICRTENGDVTLHFISENQLNFNGDKAYYSSSATEIRVQAEGRTIVYPYKFTDRGVLITFPEGFKALFVRDTRPAAAVAGKIFPQLVGEWKDIRSSGNTVITLAADGSYSYYSDFAAGNSSAGATNWGTASSNSDRGRWHAKGNPRAGTIFYRSQDGRADTLSYQVHVENGRTYWGEYYFDGTIYVKQ